MNELDVERCAFDNLPHDVRAGHELEGRRTLWHHVGVDALIDLETVKQVQGVLECRRFVKVWVHPADLLD